LNIATRWEDPPIPKKDTKYLYLRDLVSEGLFDFSAFSAFSPYLFLISSAQEMPFEDV
jgi:hypothetical protein